MNAYSGFSGTAPAMDGHLSLGSGTPQGRGRRSDRVRVALGAGLRQRGAHGVSVQILDLSTDGFRVSTHLVLEPGTDVWLRLPGLEASHARVMWTDGNLVGCAFVRPLHPAVLSMVVAKAAHG